MGYSKKNILEHLERALDTLTFTKVVYAEKEPQPEHAPNTLQRQPWCRFTLPLDGVFEQWIATGEQCVKARVTPGEVIYFMPFCWNISVKENYCDGLAVVLRRDYLRLVHSVSRPGEEQQFSENAIDYYHIEDTLRPSTIYAIKALNDMGCRPEPMSAAAGLVRVALELAWDDLKRSRSREHGKAYDTWLKIANHMEENSNMQILREDVAQKFNVTPSYVSKLFNRYANMRFSDFLTRIRIENAAKLLRETDMTVDEISWTCGYGYTSYFIKAFRSLHSISPGQYRREISPLKNFPKERNQ